jgi:hypothetical protein
MRARPWLLVGLTLLALPASAAAQKLKPGTWTGSVTAPDTPTLDATFDVRVNGDTTRITMKIAPGEMEFASIKVEADRLSFTFSPGITVRCTLMLKPDKSYAGDCLDDEGGKGVIVMIPPAAGDARPGAGLD